MAEIIKEKELTFGCDVDQLNREEIADNLTKIIESRKGSFVLSIDSSWGTGKTWFIKMWKNKLLKTKNKEILPIYFNNLSLSSGLEEFPNFFAAC